MSDNIERSTDPTLRQVTEALWSKWRRAWDIRHRLVTSGDTSGANGERLSSFLFGAAAVAALSAAVNINNAQTIFHEMPHLNAVEPIVWEGSSWVSFVLFSWIPWLAFRFSSPMLQRPWRAAAIHLVAASLFSACHVSGFIAVRIVIYWLAGDSYEYLSLDQFPYELRKDAISYMLVVVIFWAATRSVPTMSAECDAPVASMGNSFFDIRDGARLTRVIIADIIAVNSAGNYVEFLLRDGQRYLMRKSLSSISKELLPHGFVRTHRSWIVNPRAMTALKPTGSGDHTIQLGTVSAPISRRYSEALVRIRRDS